MENVAVKTINQGIFMLAYPSIPFSPLIAMIQVDPSWNDRQICCLNVYMGDPSFFSSPH